MSTSAGFKNTYFVPVQGEQGEDWKIVKVPMIASVAISSGASVYWVGDGTVTKSTSSTGNFAGILMQDIAATDADYTTSGKLKSIYMPLTNAAKAEFKVGAGTFTAADVGKSVVYYDETSVGVDSAGTQMRITDYISSTRGIVQFNLSIASN